MIKTVFDDKTGELLGAHMIGTEVTELIQGYAVARGLETTEEDLIKTVFPHPTGLESPNRSACLDPGGEVPLDHIAPARLLDHEQEPLV